MMPSQPPIWFQVLPAPKAPMASARNVNVKKRKTAMRAILVLRAASKKTNVRIPQARR